MHNQKNNKYLCFNHFMFAMLQCNMALTRALQALHLHKGQTNNIVNVLLNT